MHRCLTIQEILHMIFHSIYNPPSREGNHTLIALAVTCQSFQEVALDIIWHTQVTLVPLIKCMPPDLWQEIPKTGFERTLVSKRSVLR